MRKTTLVVMAAGIGSRFGGGIKQLEPVGPSGEIIMDYSIHDALEAGFNKVVFIIRKDLEKDFREIIGNRMEKLVETAYAFQEIDDLPDGFTKPADRTKPWGTGQAILSCKDLVNEPFAVINADDYYGQEAFRLIHDFLVNTEDGDKYQYAMVGYLLKNTLTEHGHVARGVCETDAHHKLTAITERTRIERHAEGPAYTEDDGVTWHSLPEDAPVSMNLWGFSASILKELKERFPVFLDENLKKNPLKCEYFLPFVVDELIREGKAEVTVLKSHDRWHGVTYKEDKPVVMKAMQDLKDAGKYPQNLWEE